MQHGIELGYLLVVDMPGCHENSNQKQRQVSHKDIWWTAEKLLRHQEFGLVLVWPQRPDPTQVRRLQLAADASNSIGIMMTAGRSADTPVGLRLAVARSSAGVSVELLKSRYGWRQQGKVLLP